MDEKSIIMNVSKTIKYYKDYYHLMNNNLNKCNSYQVKLYNWFKIVEQDLWLPKFIDYKQLLKDKPRKKIGIFTIAGPRWTIKYNRANIKIFMSRENLHRSHNVFWEDQLINEPYVDLTIGFDYIDHTQYIRIPLWIMWVFEPTDTYSSIQEKIKSMDNTNNYNYTNRKFCSFLSSHDDIGRRKIYDQLSTIDKIDCDGALFHNNDTLKTLYNDNKLDYLRDYRFNLTPENSNYSGYCTEKLFEAIHAGCIPIYCGSDNLPEPDVLNQDAIIFIEMGNENTNALSLVKSLNENKKMYLEYIQQPRFIKGAADRIWSYYEDLEKKLKQII